MADAKVPVASETAAKAQAIGGAAPDLSEQERVRLEKLERIRARGENPYKNGYVPQAISSELHRAFGEKNREELEREAARSSVAGRIMTFRVMGKASFVTLQDAGGTIQLFVQQDKLGEEGYQRFKELDIGDIVFSEGLLFKTRTGELSVHSDSLVLLTKALRPLPEKFHGVTDIELKYRQRYVDLIMGQQTREVFRIRSRLIDEIRAFMKANGFMEVETPMMHPIAGGANARPFVTHHNTLGVDLFLRIAPELYLKRLIVGGFDKVFEINRNFRNEGISIKHNPEFTMMEFYWAYATYVELMDFTERLLGQLADRVLGRRTLTYQGTEIHLDGPFERISVEDAILKHSRWLEFVGSGTAAPLAKAHLRDRAKLLAYGEKHGLGMDPSDSTGGLQMVIFDEQVESQLIQPTFVTQYPRDVSPLSRENEADPFVVDRFELFIYGREMGNAFSELNDPIDQRQRFQLQVDAKAAGDDEACDMDDDYVTALEYGMPPTAGEGIGIDRLCMLFTDSASIRDVILFPQMRPHGKPEHSSEVAEAPAVSLLAASSPSVPPASGKS